MATARSSIELTARGRVLAGLAAVSILGAWLSADANVRIAAALLSAPLLIDFAATTRALRVVSIHVGARRTVVGAPFQEELRVHFHGARPIRELLITEPRTRGAPAFTNKLVPDERTTVLLSCRSPQRSHLIERVFQLHSEWPLGMFAARATAVVPADFVTEPARVPLDAELLHATAEREPAPHTRSHLPGDEFHSLREHQPSEDARGVHALRSAAMGNLVRTVVHGRLPREVGLVLDMRRPPGRSMKLGSRRFEWSLGACATLLDQLRSLHAVVRMWVLASSTVRTVVQDSLNHREVLTFLSEAQVSPHRQLDPGTLDDLDQLEHCFWIPAGGYHANSDRALVKTKVRLIGALGRMSNPPEARRLQRLASLSLFTAVGAAIVSLPREVLPWPWLLALIGPAAILGLSRRPPRHPFLRALVATALQLSACVLAYQYAGSIARAAALAGTILPPMVFVTVRRLDVDATLGLFLSLCVLLVGTILGDTNIPMLAVYVVAAAVQLRCETRLGALRDSVARAQGRRDPMLGQALPGLALGSLCALAALAVDRSLGALPRLGGEDEATSQTSSRGRSVGLPDSFVLSGGGELLEMEGARLVSVQSSDGSAIPQHLYLRSGMFEVPGLDSWQVGDLDRTGYDTRGREWRLRSETSGADRQRLTMARAAEAGNRVFTPPDMTAISGLSQLLTDRDREWYREPEGVSTGEVYEVEYELLSLPRSPVIDRRWRSMGLTRLPPGDLTIFENLLDEWMPHGHPLQQARIIAQHLQERCTYLRREPDGPYRHSLLNFLDGDRSGYCMYFASAAAIMLRLADIPCRIGVGLYGGDPTDRGDARIYGSQHAHAWIEIPIDGRGWVVFDPTPPAERGVRGGQTQLTGGPQPEPEESAAADLTWFDSLLEAVTAFVQSPWPWLALILLLVLPLQRTERKKPKSAVKRAVRPARKWLLQILNELAIRGRPRLHGTTIEQLEIALHRHGALPGELRSAFDAYQEVRFGGRNWSDEHEHRMRRGLAAAKSLPKAEDADPTPSRI